MASSNGVFARVEYERVHSPCKNAVFLALGTKSLRLGMACRCAGAGGEGDGCLPGIMCAPLRGNASCAGVTAFSRCCRPDGAGVGMRMRRSWRACCARSGSRTQGAIPHVGHFDIGGHSGGMGCGGRALSAHWRRVLRPATGAPGACRNGRGCGVRCAAWRRAEVGGVRGGRGQARVPGLRGRRMTAQPRLRFGQIAPAEWRAKVWRATHTFRLPCCPGVC